MAAKVAQYTPEVMRYVEKSILLQTLDHLWREHLIMLEHLRQVVGLRGYAQRDPLNEYKSEAFQLFEAMIANMREGVTAQLMRVEVVQAAAGRIAGAAASLHGSAQDRSVHRRGRDGLCRCDAVACHVGRQWRRAARGRIAIRKIPATWGKVGRNKSCPCGSGKKYKHCHGRFG